MDLQALQVEGFADRGIGRYAAAVTTAMAARGRVAAALLAPELPPPSGLPRRLVTDDLVRWDGVATMREVLAGRGKIVHHSLAPFLHCGPTDPSVLTVAPHWAGAGCPRVATLYDLIPLRAGRHYLSAPGAVERYRSRAGWVATADLILAISEHTRSEAIELLGCEPARVVNVGAGVGSYFAPPDGTDEELFRHHLGRWHDRPFLLCVTGSDARKNTERLIEAAGLLSRRGVDIGLVVVGHLTESWVDRLRQVAQAAGVADRMDLTGSVSDELLRACYRRAELTVMPSLSEGSGLPVLESAACGTAAAASGTTALAEVTATALAQFDPTDPESIADCLQSLIGDPERRRAVVEAQAKLASGSSWGAVADVAARAYDDLAERLPGSSWSSPSAVRQSLLFAGPVRPEGGGISPFNDRLLRLLGERLDSTVVTDTATMGGKGPAGKGPV
ncbi:MAG: glycosyltransferase family 4 protein, partial [Actinomycetes bacterium]